MLTRRAVVMFGIAIVLAIAAAWLANNWVQLQAVGRAEAKAGVTTGIVVAALQIPYGQKIEPAHIKLLDWPTASIPEGAFTDKSLVEGKIAAQTFLPGEVLLSARVAEHLGGSTLAALVTPDMRAITVRVNDVIGVGGFLLPGNRVDVVSARRSNSKGAITRTVLEDLKVLAVDQTAAAEKDKPVVVRAVTLEVTPDQAEILVKATQEGAVQLTLRNPLDKRAAVKNEPAPKPKKKVVRAVPPPRSVTVIRGTEVSVEKPKI